MAAVVLVACDEKKDPAATSAPAATSSPASAAAAPAPRVDRPVEITVDADGTLISGERASGPEGPRRMRELVSKLDLKGKPPLVTAFRSAKAGDVTALVAALAAQGASEVTVRTQDRSKKDTTRALVPDSKAGKLPDCTVAITVQKDRTTASWPVRGGMATRYAKGMAGPDMSMTLEGVRKQVAACGASTAMVISGDDVVEWGLVFDLSDRVVTADPPLKITTWVVAREALVAGRPVKLGD